MKKTLNAAQAAKAVERKAHFRALWKHVAAMPECERAAKFEHMGYVSVEGRPYSIRNMMMLALQGGGTVFGGFRQWIAQGRAVRKGEHGKMILVPIGAGKEAHKAARRMPDAQKQVAAWRAGLGSPADWMSDRELRYFAERKNPNGCLVCEREANARLIAAAPALVRSCQAALAYLADPPSEFAENRAAAAELIRAALAAVTESEGA